MDHKLFIFVEGNDDERFFRWIVKPSLERKYDVVKILKYAEQKPKETKGMIKAICQLGNDYFYVHDINNFPSIDACKNNIIEKLNHTLSPDKIVVVIKEIESWYLSGLDNDCCRELGIQNHSSTDNITKEQFDNMIPQGMSRIDFMQSILGKFDVETGKKKNKSFKSFFEKWVET